MSTTTEQYTASPLSSQSRELISLIPGKLPGCYAVRLNLPFRPVFIGELRTQDEGTFHKRVDPSKHVHHDSQTIALSAAVLHAEHLHFRWIVCDIAGHGKLVTSRRFMLAHGSSFRYRNFEPQIFLPLELWGVERAREWEEEQSRRERIALEKAAQLSFFEAVA